MRHLCPTAPDTLRIYPFKESDPFIIDTSTNLALEDEGQPQSLFTSVPHVYFVGNMQGFKEEEITNNDRYLKVISVPAFHLTYELVLMDLKTLQTYTMVFNMSEGLHEDLEPVQTAEEDTVPRESMIID